MCIGRAAHSRNATVAYSSASGLFNLSISLSPPPSAFTPLSIHCVIVATFYHSANMSDI